MASVRYLVHDVDQAIAFYTQLGFTLRQQFGPAMAIVAHDDLTLWLAGPRASAAKPMPDGRVPGPGGWNRFVLQVADLSVLVASLRSQGVKIPQRHRRWTGWPADTLRRSVGQRRGAVRTGGVRLTARVHAACGSGGTFRSADALTAAARSIACAMRSSSLESSPARLQLKNMRATPSGSIAVAMTRHQCTATNAMPVSDTRSTARSMSSTTAIGLPSAPWIA